MWSLNHSRSSRKTPSPLRQAPPSRPHPTPQNSAPGAPGQHNPRGGGDGDGKEAARTPPRLTCHLGQRTRRPAVVRGVCTPAPHPSVSVRVLPLTPSPFPYPEPARPRLPAPGPSAVAGDREAGSGGRHHVTARRRLPMTSGPRARPFLRQGREEGVGVRRGNGAAGQEPSILQEGRSEGYDGEASRGVALSSGAPPVRGAASRGSPGYGRGLFHGHSRRLGPLTSLSKTLSLSISWL